MNLHSLSIPPRSSRNRGKMTMQNTPFNPFLSRNNYNLVGMNEQKAGSGINAFFKRKTRRGEN